MNNTQAALHEPGKNLVGIGLVPDGPHFHWVMVFPPSVVPTTAVVPIYGFISTDFAVAVIAVLPKPVMSPTTVITPFASAEPDDTMQTARFVSVGVPQPRRHCDPDWITFAVIPNAVYVVETGNLRGEANTNLDVLVCPYTNSCTVYR